MGKIMIADIEGSFLPMAENTILNIQNREFTKFGRLTASLARNSTVIKRDGRT